MNKHLEEMSDEELESNISDLKTEKDIVERRLKVAEIERTRISGELQNLERYRSNRFLSNPAPGYCFVCFMTGCRYIVLGRVEDSVTYTCNRDWITKTNKLSNSYEVVSIRPPTVTTIEKFASIVNVDCAVFHQQNLKLVEEFLSIVKEVG